MIIKIEGPTLINSSDMQNIFNSKSNIYLDRLNYQNSLEWQNWKKYINKNFNLDLYESLKYLLRCSKINKDEDGYILTIINSPINDKLTTESLAKMIMSGNLFIRKSNILSNIINYSLG